MASNGDGPILEVSGLSIGYATQAGLVRAVEDVSFCVRPGEVVGIVGEASAGKTTIVETIVGAASANSVKIAGQVSVDGEDLDSLSADRWRRMRGADIGYIPAGGIAHLDPLRTVGRQIEDVVRSHRRIGKSAARRLAVDLLELVGIDSPVDRTRNYPHELSGGMGQRVAIAMGLACHPRVVLADEPTSGLDVTVQVRILDLIANLISRERASAVIVTRELGIVANYCSRIIVMHKGSFVEEGPTPGFLESPKSEYGARLLELAREEQIASLLNFTRTRASAGESAASVGDGAA